jgi:hypothetical protein
MCVSEIVTRASVQKTRRYQTLAFASPLATDYWRTDRRRHRWSAVHPGLGAPSTRPRPQWWPLPTTEAAAALWRHVAAARNASAWNDAAVRCVEAAYVLVSRILTEAHAPRTADAGIFPHAYTRVYLIITISVTLRRRTIVILLHYTCIIL